VKKLLVLALLAAGALVACATSPLGRGQLILFPESEMAQMGAAAFQEIQKQSSLSTDGKVNDYVQCVSNHVLRAMPGEDPAAWEVRVFAGDEANAFALPGRKIGVYRGLLDVASNQHQLATVIGHEIAHVQAKHANERVSTTFVTQSGLQLAQIAAGASSPARQQLFGLLGLGAQVGVLLPFNRAQESEADLIGLDLMADAGFDPRESVKLWENMAKAGGARPPEFLSTHPSGPTRISGLNARMNQAMHRFNQARVAGRVPDCD
jgi:predicted Zn-dependent protease